MKQVRTLYSELMRVVNEAEGQRDFMFKAWAKTVESVDQSKADGYAFRGEFINEGDVEVEIKPQIFLVMTTRGSRKYQTATYNVVVMNADGELELVSDIQTTSKTRGWALRLRDPIANLIALLAQADDEPQPVTIEVCGETAGLWRTAKALVGGDDSDLLNRALTALLEGKRS